MDVRAWQSLAEPRHENLVREAMSVRTADVAAISRLRKICADREIVGAAIMLGEARRKAVGKFGASRAATMWADPAGVEMATSAVVGAYKWKTMEAWDSSTPVLDLCCGIGGDAMAIAGVRAAAKDALVAVDADPARAWMTGQNAACRTLCADVRDVSPADGVFHIDPARRDAGGRRAWRIEDLSPPPETWRRFVGNGSIDGRGGAIKLGPGLNIEDVERTFPEAGVEIISENGTLVQGLLRFGTMRLGGQGGAGAARRAATLVRGTPDRPEAIESWTLRGDPGVGGLPIAESGRAMRYIHEPDDSVERAGLLGTLCGTLGAPMLHPRVGLLTSDAAIKSPWITSFEVLAEMPWNQKRLHASIKELGAGMVEVKTRGVDLDADELQRIFRGSGDKDVTVFVVRCGTDIKGIVGRRAARL